LAAGELCRIEILSVQHPHPLQQLLRLFNAGPFIAFEHIMRPLNDILQDRHMRPQVKTLKDHPQPRTQALYLPGIRRQPMPAGVVLHFNRLATDADHPGIGRFQQINAAQQRTFTGAAGARIEMTSPCRAWMVIPFRTSREPKDL
jgi:hypothetical protein